MRRTACFVGLIFLLSGCASISVVPLQSDGTPAAGKANGLRYYLPRPYLLVTDLPADTAADGSNNGTTGTQGTATTGGGTTETPITGAHEQAAPGAGGQHGGAKTTNAQNSTGPALNTGNAGGTDAGTDKAKSGGDTAAAAATDTSYQATTPHYVLKLIYLPDLEHPMAIRQSSGLFGTSSLKPTLQDGWMLTALDATADTKAAEVLASVASVIGAVKGGGGGSDSGGSKGGGKTAQAPSGGPSTTTRTASILRPGLYSFDYDKDGKLAALTAITYFGCTGKVDGVPCVGDYGTKEKRETDCAACKKNEDANVKH